jgi:hypothetical protein
MRALLEIPCHTLAYGFYERPTSQCVAFQEASAGMNPMVLTADLSGEEFATFAELRDLARDLRRMVGAPLTAIYISPWQQKLLRLEVVEKRHLTNEQARQLEFKTVAGISILVWDGEGMPPCPSCGRPHGLLD